MRGEIFCAAQKDKSGTMFVLDNDRIQEDKQGGMECLNA